MNDLHTSGPSLPRWYVIYLRSRYERKVHDQLTRRSIESFQPLIWETRQWSDRKQRVQLPLFPGYNFVRIDLRDRLRVLQVDGVVKFVCIDDRPSMVPDEEIRWVKQFLVIPATLRKEPTFIPGRQVQVISGPLAGVRGYILHLKGSTRVAISIGCIGQAISVEIPVHNLKLFDA